MVEKKEILDYLRNKQKAAEINAKVNGINLWVLLGAIALVSWHLSNYIQADALRRPEVVLASLLCAEAIYFLTWLMAPSSSARKEVRFSSWRPSDVASPFLLGIYGALLLLPPALSILLVGNSFGAIFLGALGVAIFIASLAAVIDRFSEKDADAERFPKPNFGLTRRVDVVTDLVFGAAFVAAAATQLDSLRSYPSLVADETVRSLGLMVCLYWLCLIAIQRKARSLAIEWTYDLETELVLGVIAPEVALRRIEHRSLGPRLQDVLDRFFDQLDRKFEEVQAAFSACRERLETVGSIPEEYATERASRIQEAKFKVLPLIENLLADCDEFDAYLRKLGDDRPGTKRTELTVLLPVLVGRHAEYRSRARAAKTEVESALRKVVG